MILSKTIAVMGATGATGRLLTAVLLERGHLVRVVVRSKSHLPESIRNHPNLEVQEASLLDQTPEQWEEFLKGCDAVASCLGHNPTFKGLFGQPKRLVTDAVRLACQVLSKVGAKGKKRVVLMNTTVNRNRDIGEQVTFVQGTLLRLMRALLPPHKDNEEAAEYLRTQIGQDHGSLEWSAVRPGGLIDLELVTPYAVFAALVPNTIFNPGKTSRINVGHFMADLISDDALWQRWKGQMPVILNKEVPS